MKTIYLDNAASTPTDRKVSAEIARTYKLYGNPSSYNNCGRKARECLDKSRFKVARFLGAHAEEIIFTSSGTEANNLAIQGIARIFEFLIFNFKKKSKYQIIIKPHIITTQIEHPSVLNPIRQLEKEGFDVTYLPVDKEGFVNISELQKSLMPETTLVSIMYANNEIGTVEPIAKISRVIKDFRDRKLKIKNLKLEIHEKMYPLFHVDACQATEYLNMNVNHLGVDLLTFNGSKIYGPRGIGVLYKKRGVGLRPVNLGGEQEFGFRAGTENLPAISGLAVALENIDGGEFQRLSILRDYFIDKIKTLMPDIRVNGSTGDDRLANNINISVPNLNSEVTLLELDKHGIYAGSGSACTSHSVEPSHVLKAIEVEPRYINGALRFSMGRHTTRKDMDYVLKVLPKIVKELKKRYKNIR